MDDFGEGAVRGDDRPGWTTEARPVTDPATVLHRWRGRKQTLGTVCFTGEASCAPRDGGVVQKGLEPRQKRRLPSGSRFPRPSWVQSHSRVPAQSHWQNQMRHLWKSFTFIKCFRLKLSHLY